MAVALHICMLFAAFLFATAHALLRQAQTLLYTKHYSEAAAIFRQILTRNPNDGDARLGLAQAEYWSGDYRSALRDFRRVANRAEARRAIAEIEAYARPGWTVSADALSDDQPYRAFGATASVFAFSDPLTKWQLDVSDAHRTSNGLSATTPFLRGSGATSIGRFKFTAALARQRFPDDTSRWLPAASVGSGDFTISYERQALLRTTASLRTHPWADAITASWRRGDEAAVEAQHLRYFDGNSGNGADGWLLHSFGAFSAGGSAAWRDTSQSRFLNGVFDPYYTPQQLVEARGIVAAKWSAFSLHADGGIGHEKIVGSFHPWRVAASYTFRNVTLSAERSATAFYTANEIHASVAGRF